MRRREFVKVAAAIASLFVVPFGAQPTYRKGLGI